MELTKKTLCYSQLSYKLGTTLCSALPELESKEKGTHERSSLKLNIV